MSCNPERVTGYVDGELPPEEGQAVEEHLRGCAACREQVDAERGLRTRLKALPEAEARAGFEGHLHQRIRFARPSPLRFLVPAAAALAAVLLWAGGSPVVVAWELSRDHDHCFGMSTLPAEILTSDPAAAAARLAPPGLALPSLPRRAAGLELVGGRRCPLADRRVVHLYYASRENRVSVFLVPDGVRLDDRYATDSRANAVRLLRVAGTTIGIVGEDDDVVAAFEQALLQTRV